LSWVSIFLLAPIAAIVYRQAAIPPRSISNFWKRHLQYVARGVLLAAFCTIGFMLIYAENAFDYNRCPIRHWLGTSLLLSLCILLMMYSAPRGSWLTIVFATAALAVAANSCLGLPNKEHAFRNGWLAPNALVVWSFVAIPVVLGAFCIITFSIERLGKLNYIRMKRFIIIGAMCFMLLLVLSFSVIGARIMTADTREMIPHWSALIGWIACTVLAVIALCAWAMRDEDLCDTAEVMPLQGGLVRIISVVFVMLTVFAVGGISLAAAISTSSYLSNHLSQQRFVPDLGWESVVATIFAIMIGVFFEVVHIAKFRSVNIKYSWVAIICLTLVGGLQLARTNMAVGQSVFTRAIVCLDAHTGTLLWTCEGLPGPQGILHRANSAATPTAVYGRDRILAYFGSAGLMCADSKGALLWVNKDIPFNSAYGVGTSPAYEDGIAVIVSGNPEAPFVCAIDVETGQQIWRQSTECKPARVSGVSRTPLIMNVSGINYVILWDISSLDLYDLRTGEKRWKIPLAEASGDMVASVATDGRRLYCSSSSETFVTEVITDGIPPKVAWRTRFHGANCASPVCANGLLFVISDNGVLTCLNTETGKICWRKRLTGEFHANPLVVGKHLYVTNRVGTSTVIAVDKQLQIISENELGQPISATFAVAHGCLYTRGEKHVMCISNPGIFQK